MPQDLFPFLKVIPTALILSALILEMVLLTGCGEDAIDSGEIGDVEYTVTASESDIMEVRSNETVVLEPSAPGTVVYGNGDVEIDVSNASEGYFVVFYAGDNSKVKMQVTGPNGVTYTYNLTKPNAVIPITSGDGKYTLVIYENIADNQYSTLYAVDCDFRVTNTYGPYLYPNQYVSFDKNSEAVALARELASGAKSDIEVITSVYSYLINNISYDEEKLSTAEKTYLPDVDVILNENKGICFDYAALMAAMLRSQRIPTRMEIGYAGDAYHAWISVYIEDQGWVSGMIQFTGENWTLMDPTFAANTDEKQLKSFIGDGSNYTTKYIY